MPELSRRSLITGLISLVAAPAIVRVSSIMPVKQMLSRPFGAIRVPWIITSVLHSLGDDGYRRTANVVGEGMGEFSGQEFVVRVSPLAGQIKLGDQVWIDRQTGEIC